jgi:DNA-binding Lrp family transcriptional regulator
MLKEEENMPYVTYVLINTTLGQEESVRKELLKIKEVTRADTTSGAYDNVAILEGESVDYLIDVIMEKIRKIPSIVKTESLIARAVD